MLGTTVATLFVIPGVLGHDYAIIRYLSHKGHAKRSLSLWGIAFAGALMLAFVTKTSDTFSRGASLGLVVAGYAALLGVRALIVSALQHRAQAGRVASRHIFLVGDEDMISAFSERHAPHRVGLRIVGAAVLRPGDENRCDDLALAAASARVLRPDDIYILVPWGERERLEACIDTFMGLPATIQLAPERFFDKFDDLHVIRNGSVASIHLVRRPLSSSEVVAKRALDLVLALSALLLLSPLFLAVAILIKREGGGPVFFQQRRYGFNQEPFHIYKFRSMRTHGGRAGGPPSDGGRQPHHAGRSLHAPHQHRRVAAAHQRAAGRDVARRPTASRHGARPGLRGRGGALCPSP